MPQKRRGRGAKGATSTRVKKGALPKEAEPRSLIVRLKINSARLGVEDASPTEVHPFTPPSSPPELPMAPGPQEELESAWHILMASLSAAKRKIQLVLSRLFKPCTLYNLTHMATLAPKRSAHSFIISKLSVKTSKMCHRHLNTSISSCRRS